MKKLIVSMLVSIVLVTGGVWAQANKGEVKKETANHKVVIQLSTNDAQQWNFLMNNLKFLKAAWNEQVAIEVVAYGPGVDMLMTNSAQKEKITEFKKQGVSFVACENTMRVRGITKQEILPDAGFVPSGVGELVLKQEQGWGYFKAGY